MRALDLARQGWKQRDIAVAKLEALANGAALARKLFG